jgi:ElaB/YqjD/DUF883 family membrane-anchored ribosome-binding protein
MEGVMARTGAATSTRITVLETQVESISTDINKMSEKIDANYATLHHRISDMRDDFHRSLEEKHEKIMDKLDAQAKASTEQHRAIADKMHVIEKWRWMTMGAAIVVGYVLAHVKLENLF